MLALVAGQGHLPEVILANVAEPIFVAALEGFPPEVSVDVTFRMERLGGLLQTLKSKGATRVCLAGSISRPEIDPSAVDEETQPYLHRIAQALHLGDDGALREILKIFEENGLHICAAHELVPSLLPEVGVLSSVKPTERDKQDARRAMQIMALTASADIGQSCIVSEGQALAVETLGGTNWMLATVARERPKSAAPGGVFVKAPKPIQDRRVDLPVIGPETVVAAADAGLNGIVIEAGGVMVLSKEETIRIADETGLFLWVREAD